MGDSTGENALHTLDYSANGIEFTITVDGDLAVRDFLFSSPTSVPFVDFVGVVSDMMRAAQPQVMEQLAIALKRRANPD